MRRRTGLVIVIGLLLLSGLTACGGGGSDSSDVISSGNPAANETSSNPSADPNQSFPLFNEQSQALGTIYSFQLSGSDNFGSSLTGTIAVANREEIMLDGVLVRPQEQIFIVSDGEISVSVSGFSYFDSDRNFIATYLQTTDVFCASTSPDRMPDTVKIGDFGIRSPTVCDDNTVMDMNWRVEDAGNGNIYLYSNGVMKNQFNEITDTSEQRYTYDNAGNIIAFRSISYNVDLDYQMTLESI